jgi:hypothetical protein
MEHTVETILPSPQTLHLVTLIADPQSIRAVERGRAPAR